MLRWRSSAPTTVAQRIIDLHRRHAAAVCNVFDGAIRNNAAKLRDGSLPADCLLSLVVGQGAEDPTYPAPRQATVTLAASAQEIRTSIDEVGKRVIFERWGEIRGVGAELLMALATPFREARKNELAPEHYPFLKSSKLMRQLKCEENEALRRRILRARNAIKKLAKNAGDLEPPMDAVIESSQWHGYRLNPDRVRLIALKL